MRMPSLAARQICQIQPCGHYIEIYGFLAWAPDAVHHGLHVLLGEQRWYRLTTYRPILSAIFFSTVPDLGTSCSIVLKKFINMKSSFLHNRLYHFNK